MKRAPALLLALTLAGLPLACRQLSDLNRHPADKVRLMEGARTVLARHFEITAVDWTHGVVAARSVTGANLAAKYRTRAVATVFRVGPGDYECEIRVTNELEVSEPSLMGGAQPPYDWRAAGFDKPLEAALMAELDAEMAGPQVAARPPRRSHFMWMPPKPTTSPWNPQGLFKPRVPNPDPPQREKAPAAGRPAPGPRPPARPEPQARRPQPRVAGQLFEQYMDRGDRHMQRGEYQKALLEYQRAAFARPEEVGPQLSLAAVWAALDRYEQAAEALRQAADAARADAPDGRQLQRLARQSRDVADRLLLLKGWLKKNPRDTDARLVLGYHCLLADRADEAEKNLRHVLDARPGEPAARYLLRLL
jgi:hypothetical protein